MNNLTKEQMLELAKIVTGQHAEIDEDRVLYTPYGPGTAFLLWSPAIDGAAWQAKQALEVIVAAFNLGDEFVMRKIHGSITYEATTGIAMVDRCIRSGIGPDLLTACALALISGGRS